MIVIAQKAPLEGWVAVERDRKRKGKATHKLRERHGLFFTFGWLVCQMSFICLKREETGEIKTGGEPLPYLYTKRYSNLTGLQT